MCVSWIHGCQDHNYTCRIAGSYEFQPISNHVQIQKFQSMGLEHDHCGYFENCEISKFLPSLIKIMNSWVGLCDSEEKLTAVGCFFTLSTHFLSVYSVY